MHYKCHKTNPNRGGSDTDSPDWLKTKEVTINRINKKDSKCFQYAVKFALNHEELQKKSQRITNITAFINKHNWGGIHFPSEKYDWKKIEKIENWKFALTVLYAKREKICCADVSKHNSNREKQVILLMISNGEKCEATDAKLRPKDDDGTILQ